MFLNTIKVQQILYLIVISIKEYIINYYNQQKPMKLKNLKKEGKKKEPKKQQPKQQVEETTNFEDDQQQRDDALVDLKDDLNKKQQPKQKGGKRAAESNKLEQVQIDTSKIKIDKKVEVKAPLSTWVTSEDDAKKLLEKDFNMQEVDHEFESLTNTKLNQQLKKKKQSKPEPKFEEASNGIKFAAINFSNSAMENKNTQKLVMGRPQNNDIISTSSSLTPTLNFTNSKLNENVKVSTIQKSPQQLREQQIERKMEQSMAKRALQKAAQPEVVPSKGKGTWFKKSDPVATQQKQAPKMQFKSSLNFTNSKGAQGFGNFKPLEKTKQQLLLQEKEKHHENVKYTNKKEVEQRRKKMQQERIAQQQKGVKVSQTA